MLKCNTVPKIYMHIINNITITIPYRVQMEGGGQRKEILGG
jgi:hypothetical protein